MIKILLLLIFSLNTNALEVPKLTMSESLQEQKQGNEFLQMIWNTGSVVADIETQIYLKSLGYELIKYSENPNKHFGFFLLDDDSINAFAGSYGYIGVHTGMLLSSDAEAELAGVLSHEISHVTQNHLMRFSEKTDKQTYVILAGILASVLVKNPEVSQAIATSTIAATAQQNINFTRNHEWEADRIGTNMLIKSGFNPQGMANFFEKLQDDVNAQEFLLSHPLSINRISDSMQRTSRIKGDYRKNSFTYKTVKARLYYQQNKHIQAEEKDTNVILYMQAYNAFEKQKYPTAKGFIEKLLLVNNDKSSYILAGRIYAKLKNIKQAQQYFSQVVEDDAIIYYASQAYLDNNQTQKGIDLLRHYLKRNDGDYLLHKLLARLYVDEGSLDRSHIHNAEALVRQGKLDLAVAHYQRAKAITQSQDLFDVIEVKIERLEKRINLYEKLP
jgi:predicted Zn-dependent protease